MTKDDIRQRPSPLLDTNTISTTSLRRLKYWPTIRVAGYLVIATPNPESRKRKGRGEQFGSKAIWSGPEMTTYHGPIAEEELVKLARK
jgi:hypothetical protein